MASAKPGKIMYAGCVALFLFLYSQSVAQQPDLLVITPPDGSAVAAQPQMTLNPSPDTAAATSDPTLTTHETAVECAMALIVESAGERHVQLSDPAGNGFKAGLCTGKIQTYMLSATAQHPDCFPKIDLEEGMRMFVKWAEAHPEEGGTPYMDGFKKAFEDAVPCLKKQ